jgi:hypothetical protein
LLLAEDVDVISQHLVGVLQGMANRQKQSRWVTSNAVWLGTTHQHQCMAGQGSAVQLERSAACCTLHCMLQCSLQGQCLVLQAAIYFSLVLCCVNVMALNCRVTCFPAACCRCKGPGTSPVYGRQPVSNTGFAVASTVFWFVL